MFSHEVEIFQICLRFLNISDFVILTCIYFMYIGSDCTLLLFGNRCWAEFLICMSDYDYTNWHPIVKQNCIHITLFRRNDNLVVTLCQLCIANPVKGGY